MYNRTNNINGGTRRDDLLARRELQGDIRENRKTVAGFGVRSAINNTRLIWNDQLAKMNRDDMVYAQATKRFDNDTNSDYLKAKQKMDYIQNEVLPPIKQSEKENLKNYNKYLESIDNDFLKFGANLEYGAITSMLNPIELTKNMALNTVAGVMLAPVTAGMSVPASIGINTAVNWGVDFIDNFLSNRYYNELLDEEPIDDKTNIIQSIGGATLSNIGIPLFKLGVTKGAPKLYKGFKKALKLDTNADIVLKGKTVRTDITNPDVATKYSQDLENVTTVDYGYDDANMKRAVKNQYLRGKLAEQEGFTARETKIEELTEELVMWQQVLDNLGKNKSKENTPKFQETRQKIRAIKDEIQELQGTHHRQARETIDPINKRIKDMVEPKDASESQIRVDSIDKNNYINQKNKEILNERKAKEKLETKAINQAEYERLQALKKEHKNDNKILNEKIRKHKQKTKSDIHVLEREKDKAIKELLIEKRTATKQRKREINKETKFLKNKYYKDLEELKANSQKKLESILNRTDEIDVEPKVEEPIDHKSELYKLYQSYQENDLSTKLDIEKNPNFDYTKTIYQTSDGSNYTFLNETATKNYYKEKLDVNVGMVDVRNLYKRLEDDVIFAGENLKETAIKIANQSGRNGIKDTDKDLAFKKSQVGVVKNALEFWNDFIVTPLETLRLDYTKKTMDDIVAIHPELEIMLGMDAKNKGLSDVVGRVFGVNGDRQSIARGLMFDSSDSMYGNVIELSKMNPDYIVNDNIKIKDLNFKAIEHYTNTLNKNFNNSINNVVMQDELYNANLMKTHPFYAKYFKTDTTKSNLDDFTKETFDIMSEIPKQNLTPEQATHVLLFREFEYNQIAKNMRAKGEIVGTYQNFLDNFNVNGATIDADLDYVKHQINIIRANRRFNAKMKLILDKSELLGTLEKVVKDDDMKALTSLLDDETYFSKELDINLVKEMITSLNETTHPTSKKNKVIALLKGEEAKEFDLVDFVEEFFVGENLSEKKANFLKFANGRFFRENSEMLDMANRMILNDQTSMSAFGVPFRLIQNIVNDPNTTLEDILTAFPQFKGMIARNEINLNNLKKYGFKEFSNTYKEILKTYIDKRAVDVDDYTYVDNVTDTTLKIVRAHLLCLTGLGETFLHPFIASTKQVKYGGMTPIRTLAQSPISIAVASGKLVGTAASHVALGIDDTVNWLARHVGRNEPVINLALGVHKLRNGIAELLTDNGIADFVSSGLDMDIELANMELFFNADLIFSKASLTNSQKRMNGLNKFSLSIQETMQVNRYIASRIAGIRTLKKWISKSSYQELNINAKRMLEVYGVFDDSSYIDWKKEIFNNGGLKKVLYEKTDSLRTRQIHDALTRVSYAEDPLGNLKKTRLPNDIVTRFTMMFTDFTRAFTRYGYDALRYTQNDKGQYVKRSFNRDIGQGVGTGLYTVVLMALGGMASEWVQGNLERTTRDEAVESKVLSAWDGNFNSLVKVTVDGALNGLNLGWVFENKFGTPVSSVLKQYFNGGKKILNGDIGEGIKDMLPWRIPSMLFGENYKKPYGLNSHERYYYDLIMAKQLGLIQTKITKPADLDMTIEQFTKLRAIDNAVELGFLTESEALERKREMGFDDKKVMKDLENKGLETVSNYSIFNAENKEAFDRMITQGIDLIHDDNLSEKEIVESMDKANGWEPDYDRYKEDNKNYKSSYNYEYIERTLELEKAFQEGRIDNFEYWRLSLDLAFESFGY